MVSSHSSVILFETYLVIYLIIKYLFVFILEIVETETKSAVWNGNACYFM